MTIYSHIDSYCAVDAADHEILINMRLHPFSPLSPCTFVRLDKLGLVKAQPGCVTLCGPKSSFL